MEETMDAGIVLKNSVTRWFCHLGSCAATTVATVELKFLVIVGL